MTRSFVCIGLFAWFMTLSVGCGGTDSDRRAIDDIGGTSERLVDCTTYNGYTAALAEATIDCIGTIGPGTFGVDGLGLLGRNFSACTVPGGGDPLLRIDRLLSLQLRADLPISTVCFAQAWSTWLLTTVTDRITVCPVWTKLSATGSPTTQNVEQNTTTLPLLPDASRRASFPIGKEQFVYSVQFPSPLPLLQGCRTPQACARACTAGLAGFYVGESGNDVVGDPYWWLDPNDYGSNSPYRSPGFYHPMSYADDDVPGAIYGDWARRGDTCSWWNGYQHVYGTLWEDKLDPSNQRTWTSRCD
jgi:hypothetical protein